MPKTLGCKWIVSLLRVSFINTCLVCGSLIYIVRMTGVCACERVLIQWFLEH